MPPPVAGGAPPLDDAGGALSDAPGAVGELLPLQANAPKASSSAAAAASGRVETSVIVGSLLPDTRVAQGRSNQHTDSPAVSRPFGINDLRRHRENSR
jgi:hypothetical protein